MIHSPDDYEFDFTKVENNYSLNRSNFMAEDFPLGRVLWLRFLRGGIAGALSTGSTVTFMGGGTFHDLTHFFSVLGVSLVVGFITGALLTADKFVRV